MITKSTVLIVDDERRIRNLLASILKMKGFTTIEAKDGKEALEQIEKSSIDVILLDLMMPGISGIEVFETLQESNQTIPVIIITAYGSISTAVDLIKKGAYDFIEKPLDAEKILVTIKNAVEKSRLTLENMQLRQNLAERYKMVGKSPATQHIFQQIELLAPKDTTVLITGETGTGKELVARSLHNLSPRIAKPFVKVNCTAIPSELVESELFGHRKGAFTSAVNDKPGKFQAADGGTIFLDEIGELSTQLQAKLLQVLEEKSFTPVGDVEEHHIDARLIAATNRDINKEVKEKRFREDLFYRLNTVQIHIPPLRERMEDIPELVNYYLDQLCEELKLSSKKLANGAMSAFLNQSWPGNVRELKHKLEEMLIYHDGDTIDAAYAHHWLNEEKTTETSSDIQQNTSLRDARYDFERDYIHKALITNSWNISATANYLGIERTNLYRKMKALGIEGRKAN